MELQSTKEQLKDASGEVAKMRTLQDKLKLSEVKVKAAQQENEVSTAR